MKRAIVAGIPAPIQKKYNIEESIEVFFTPGDPSGQFSARDNDGREISIMGEDLFGGNVAVTGNLGRLCMQLGSKCSICGGFFSEGDDVCSAGGHVIGETYSV